jgi:hypothetical protein
VGSRTSICLGDAGGVLERRRPKVVGKPYAGEPHVRFEVAGDGNQDTVGLVRHSQRKRGATDRPHLRPRRHSLTLPPDAAPFTAFTGWALRRQRALAGGDHWQPASAGNDGGAMNRKRFSGGLRGDRDCSLRASSPYKTCEGNACLLP